VTVTLLASLTAWSPEASAQFFATCRDGAVKELEANVRAHAEHTYRMMDKLAHGVYKQSALPSDSDLATLADVQGYLEKLQQAPAGVPRSVGVLFLAYADGQLCTWLISRKTITSHVAAIGREEHDGLRLQLLGALGVSARARSRGPVQRGAMLVEPVDAPADPKAALRRAGEVLFPPSVAARIRGEQIDTLVVVPHFDFGNLPWPAIEFQGRPLVDVVSVLVVPGLASFRLPPGEPPPGFPRAIVVGDPRIPRDKDYTLPPLPGARAEAEAVAKLVAAQPLTGSQATRVALRKLIETTHRNPALVYLATHGAADPVNPVEGGLLWFSDGRWAARDIQNLPLRGGRPLVVLSACQTGLGKTFDVGVIGMAQAWERAGARSLVMSLWRVDDAATSELMTRFLVEALKEPPDKALQTAMRDLRTKDPDPAHWASFVVYGLPGR
jgi:hypothetical protein